MNNLKKYLFCHKIGAPSVFYQPSWQTSVEKCEPKVFPEFNLEKSLCTPPFLFLSLPRNLFSKRVSLLSAERTSAPTPRLCPLNKNENVQ